MAVLRRHFDNEATINYIGTLAIFCAISCTIIMLKFRAKLNLTGKKNKEIANEATAVSVNGAYRSSGDEFFDYGSLTEPPKRTPAVVNLPPNTQSQLRSTKSTSDMAQVAQTNNVQRIRSSTPEVTLDPRGNAPNNAEKTKKEIAEQKKLEKQRAVLQKRRDKIIAREQAKNEKLRKDMEKKEAQKRAKEAKKQGKTKVPPVAVSNEAVAQPRPRNPLNQGTPYSTNTLESSISRSSGPPPYANIPQTEVVENKTDKTGNTSFVKKVPNDDSWDLVSKHREQMVKPTSSVGSSKPKQMVLDLQFSNKAQNTASAVVDNSEA